jgi:hypothetical protein
MAPSKLHTVQLAPHIGNSWLRPWSLVPRINPACSFVGEEVGVLVGAVVAENICLEFSRPIKQIWNTGTFRGGEEDYRNGGFMNLRTGSITQNVVDELDTCKNKCSYHIKYSL